MIHPYPVPNSPLDAPIPAPSPRTARPGRYEDLIEAVRRAAGEWVAMSPSIVRGRDAKTKSITLHGAGAARGIKVKTTSQNGFLYCGMVGPVATVAKEGK
jgi:hypothetical protein